MNDVLITGRLPVQGPALDSFFFPEDHALFVVGDAHGQNLALRCLLDRMGRIPTPGKHRVLVFLGDLIDRGPDSLGCLETALGDAQDLAQADETVLLPGNHELMLADTFPEVCNSDETLHDISVAETWVMNGGMSFMIEAFESAGKPMPDDPAEAILAFEAMLPHQGHECFEAMVRSWPSHYRLGDALCVHAGLMPGKPHAFTFDLTQEDHFPESRFDTETHDRHWAWVRDKFLAWQGGWPADGSRGSDGVLVLHGHTAPPRCRIGRLKSGTDVETVFSRMGTNARICLDGGAARGVGVTGAVIEGGEVRICFSPGP